MKKENNEAGNYEVKGYAGQCWLYSDKVKGHFFHPRNTFKDEKEEMRWKKEADGIGLVGSPACGDVMEFYIKVDKDNDKNLKKSSNKKIITECRWKTFGCCEKGQLISTPAGFIPIERIKIGNNVYNHTGRESLVEETSKRKNKKYIFEITPLISKFNDLRLTEEHPVLAIKRKYLKYSRIQKHASFLQVNYDILINTEPQFTLVKELERGDYLVYQYPKKIKDISKIKKEELKLLGFYLSEGYFSAMEKCSGNYGLVAFAFHKNERDYINELKILLEDKFGKKPSERIRGNVSEIYLCSRKAIRFFDYYCGHMARNKKLHLDLIHLPIRKQRILLDYYFKGDGYLYKDKRNNRRNQYCMTTASEQLALQLQQIIARLGYFATVSKRKTIPSKIDGRLIDSKDSFVIIYIKDKKKKSFAKKAKNYYLIPIGEIKKKKYEDFVYNLQVSGEHKSYLVKGFAVHNCASAIASTSMLSEMVIGKTLDEAKKIKPQDIVKKLGGLPPRKIHCSVLGDQALRKAIEDYENKC